MKTKKSKLIYLLIGLLAIFLCWTGKVLAGGCPTTIVDGPYSVSTSSTNCYGWNSGDLNITSSGWISPTAVGADTINTSGSVGTLTNDGSIYNSTTVGGPSVIRITNNATALINNYLIQNAGDAYTVYIDTGTLSTLTNAGQIINTNSSASGVIGVTGSLTNLNNLVTGRISGAGSDAIDVFWAGSLASLNNAGNITTDTYAAVSAGGGGSITNIINGGTISNTGTVGGAGYWSLNDGGSAIYNSGHILSITNTGSIYTNAIGAFGIYNNTNTTVNDTFIGQIDVLNNLQGAGNTHGALTYTGALPTSYNIIINSPTSFGRLAVNGGVGSTAFGIYIGSVVLNNTSYSAVLSGITSSQLSNASGTYGGYSWALGLESGSSDVWDLIFGAYIPAPDGPSIANTQQSLVNTATALQSTYTLQNSVLANSFSYDCSEFGTNGICISAGGRNTAVSAANGLNNTSGLLIAAYRPHQNYRVGAYVDQNLSVNNAGSTVNLGNNTPLMGLFGAWNERLDGTGTEVKVSAAYGQKNTTVTRSVVGTGDTASEAGTGGSKLNSQGAQVTAKYGFGVIDNVVVSPYAGIRYTQNNMGGYTEATSSTVTAPLTYSALNTNATTALAGVGASYRFTPKATVYASAGVETDTNTANGTYSATGITGLTPINFNANPVKTRPTATLGAYYDVEKNQRIGLTGIYRQEPFQSVSTTTVMATYTVGL